MLHAYTAPVGICTIKARGKMLQRWNSSASFFVSSTRSLARMAGQVPAQMLLGF